MSAEVWKDVPGYEGYYQISSLGRVRSLERTVTRPDGRTAKYPERILKINLSHNGKTKEKKFKRVRLSKNSKCQNHYINKLMKTVGFRD